MENVISILFCLTLLYVPVTSRVRAYVGVLMIQGLLLSLVVIFPFWKHMSFHLLFIPLASLIIKVFLIPRFINKLMIDIDVRRIVEPSIQPINFLLLMVFTMSAIFVSTHMLLRLSPIEPIPFASAFSAIVLGIYLIIFRKKLIVHVIGFLIVENGIFLLGTTVAAEMPAIVELGALLDIFVVVFLMGIAINRINSSLEKIDVTALGRLKD